MALLNFARKIRTPLERNFIRILTKTCKFISREYIQRGDNIRNGAILIQSICLIID